MVWQNSSITLYQMNIIFCPNKKGKDPRYNCHPQESLFWPQEEGKAQLGLPQGQVPHLAQPSPLKELGSRDRQPSGSQATQSKGDQVPQSVTRQTATAIRSQRQDERKVHHSLKAWARLLGGLGRELWSPAGHRLPSSYWVPQLTRLGELEGLREKARINSYLLSTSGPPFIEICLNPLIIALSQTVICLWRGPCSWPMTEQCSFAWQQGMENDTQQWLPASRRAHCLYTESLSQYLIVEV